MEVVLFLLMVVTMVALCIAKIFKIIAAYIWLKSLASLFFVATGIASYQKMKQNKLYYVYILSGLIFSFLGDVLLELSKEIPVLFLVGVGSFAICHIMYSIGFCTLKKISVSDIFICLSIIIPVFLVQFFGDFNYKGMRFVVMEYTVLISFMVSKAISLRCYYRDNKKAVIMTITGAVMFLISDMLLLFYFYSPGSHVTLAYLNTIIYYLGQGILALSLSKKLDVSRVDC